MRRNRASWWAFILMLAVLLVPLRAHADLWLSFYSSGGTDPSGDPDQPTGPGDDRVSPGVRLGGGTGGDGVHRSLSSPIRRVWMNRYLTLLSGLRSYYLHF
jgi:hypothetical protein